MAITLHHTLTLRVEASDPTLGELEVTLRDRSQAEVLTDTLTVSLLTHEGAAVAAEAQAMHASSAQGKAVDIDALRTFSERSLASLRKIRDEAVAMRVRRAERLGGMITAVRRVSDGEEIVLPEGATWAEALRCYPLGSTFVDRLHDSYVTEVTRTVGKSESK